MSDNIIIPYVLQLKDGVSAIHLSEIEGVSGPRNQDVSNIAYLPSLEREIKQVKIEGVPGQIKKDEYLPTVERVCVQPVTQITGKAVNFDSNMDVEFHSETPGLINYIYEVVYPEQLDLKPIYSVKRGRPKKKKVEGAVQAEPAKPLKPAPRTRSGRVVRFPKHIEKDFAKVELENKPTENGEIQIRVSDFTKYEEEPNNVKTEIIDPVHPQRRRKIASQYRCPKCEKAYLGKTKMIQHIKKYPDHGPLPESNNQLNFDVWNYLVDITQKCPPAQRGIKFCEELTNLLHNVLLLTSALFKDVELNKNHVDVDKVLGNAIGLNPGQYKFNDNELYKDVTVLKLITNTDFFVPVNKQKGSVENVNGGGEKASEEVYKEISQTNPRDTPIYFEEPPKEVPLQYPSKITDKIETDHSLANGFDKKTAQPQLDDRISVHPELLSENSLLNLPNCELQWTILC